MKKLLVVFLITGILIGIGLPVAANAGTPGSDGILYWSKEDVNSLFSPSLMNSLNLTRSQRNSLDELRRRSWNNRPKDRYSNDLEALFNLGRLQSGSRVVIERGNDNLQNFLALLAIGVLINQTQDNDRYNDRYYDQGIRVDDFLYLFSQILNMNQRRTFTIYFDRWYDNRYYNRNNYRDQDRYRMEVPREWNDRLHLSDRQRREIEQSFRDLYDRDRDKDRKYRDLEKDYLKKTWDRSPSRDSRDIEDRRDDLLKLKRDSLHPERDARDKFRSVLDNKQRKIFDSMLRDDDDSSSHWDQNDSENHPTKRFIKPKDNH